mmetsp:Transcript_24532/g.97353  ORF Transcript_24532/g.97353 Transcript_24532/m.97353 type:complete len:203 (-) Transcript_24532:598-1206(-)
MPAHVCCSPHWAGGRLRCVWAARREPTAVKEGRARRAVRPPRGVGPVVVLDDDTHHSACLSKDGEDLPTHHERQRRRQRTKLARVVMKAGQSGAAVPGEAPPPPLIPVKSRLRSEGRLRCSNLALTSRSNLGGSTGMKRHATASEEPTRAIHTTETADGTRAASAPKWSFASKKPNAEDFIEVSMAIVRHVVSPKPRARAIQ